MSKRIARPVAILDAQVMLYAIDPQKNQSKFYEMSVVPYGQEDQDPKAKVKDHSRGMPGFALQRQWGRLTDRGGVSGRSDKINDLFSSEGEAHRMMHKIKSDKMRGKGSAPYTDVTRTREYPIGLGAAGFGWGGQAVCRVIPELSLLRQEMERILMVTERASGQIRPIALQDSETAQKVSVMLTSLETQAQGLLHYLNDQLKHCR